MLGCFLIGNTHEILKDMHEGACGGHFAPKVTINCIISVGYYWLTNFEESYDFIRRCLAFQKK